MVRIPSLAREVGVPARSTPPQNGGIQTICGTAEKTISPFCQCVSRPRGHHSVVSLTEHDALKES